MSQRKESLVVAMQTLRQSVPPVSGPSALMSLAAPWKNYPLIFMCPLNKETREKLMMVVTCSSWVYKLYPYHIWISQAAPRESLDYSWSKINYALSLKIQFMKKKVYEKFLEVSFICENSKLKSYRNLEGSWNFTWFQDSQTWDFAFSCLPLTSHIRLFLWYFSY